jgi:hypothetical protein
MSMAGDFSGRTLRANPLYELVPFERLDEAEQRALATLEADPATYGILRPRAAAAGLPVKSADRDTALLFLTLREPGPLPSYVRRAFGASGLQAVTRLVADGILEIEEGGIFLSGAAALPWLTGTRDRSAPGTRLATLSLAALRYGHSLTLEEPGLDALSLAARLYGYNTWPLTPRWHRLLSSAEAAQAWLGLQPDGPHRRHLQRTWSPLAPSPGWHHWAHRSPAFPGDGPTYKLYISPAPDALADGFGAILDALAAARPFQFKVGAGAPGLLRPDKIVAYFPDFDRLAGAAAAITDRLTLPAQGVPFTAEIAGDGLLSWGIDPPATERIRESWRFWLVQRLAKALLSPISSPEVPGRSRPAQATGRVGEGSGEAPPTAPSTDATARGPAAVHFALERLRLEGIDTGTWTPGSLLWKEKA